MPLILGHFPIASIDFKSNGETCRLQEIVGYVCSTIEVALEHPGVLMGYPELEEDHVIGPVHLSL